MNRRMIALVGTLALGLAASLPASPPRDPFAGPLEVRAMTHGGAQPGGFLQADLAVLNLAPDATIDAIVTHALVRWSDGSAMRLDLGGKRVQLEPGGGLVQFLVLAIPEDAPLGPAAVEIRAHVARMQPASGAGGVGHRELAGDGHAVDVAPFVVAP